MGKGIRLAPNGTKFPCQVVIGETMKKNIKYLVGLIVFAFLFTGCDQETPLRDCPIETLLLVESDFPDGTFVDDPSSPVAEHPIESAGITASYSDDLIFHLVGRYPSNYSASKEYSKSLARTYKGKDAETWKRPAELSFISSVAQQFAAACGNSIGKYQCRMFGQYEEYYVFFFAYISDKGITLESFQTLTQKIDLKMTQCLQK